MVWSHSYSDDVMENMEKYVMSDIYYYGNQPMFKYTNETGVPQAIPLDPYLAEFVVSLKLRNKELEAKVEDDQLHIENLLRRQHSLISHITFLRDVSSMILTAQDKLDASDRE